MVQSDLNTRHAEPTSAIDVAPASTANHTLSADVVVVGGGLSGIVTATLALQRGLSVVLIDRDSADRLGGLARWAFGGMALVGTPMQARRKIVDTPELALQDWIRFGELQASDFLALRWAEHYVERSRPEVYDWLIRLGLKFLPAVNWVERGRQGEGNSVPRYHLLWGTGHGLVERLIQEMQSAHQGHQSQRHFFSGTSRTQSTIRPHTQLTCLHEHQVLGLDLEHGALQGVWCAPSKAGETRAFRIKAARVVLAMGGVNGSLEKVMQNWLPSRPRPKSMLNGAHPYSDGELHHAAAQQLGAGLSHLSEMWNYAAGFPHPQPRFPGHGLSTVPCKSALWLDHRGHRLGPEHLVTGFDTHWMCEQVAGLPESYTWHLFNRRIALKEFAISGSEHNPRIRDHQVLAFLWETLTGNRRLVRQMTRECPQWLEADTLDELACKMNALTGTSAVQAEVLKASVQDFDRHFDARGRVLPGSIDDEQIRRIEQARQWGPDRLRTCAPAPLQRPGVGPWIALQVQLITRKSLGGLQTDMRSRVLKTSGDVIPGLYSVGEAAGFGGGGCCGKRSLEGTFLPGCILTAKAAVADF